MYVRIEVNSEVSPDQLTTALDGLVAIENGTRIVLLDKIDEYDRAELWKGDGVYSMGDWLAYRYGMAHRTAHEFVRVARALRELPAIKRAFAEARLSWEKVCVLTKFVEPDEDELWAVNGQNYSHHQLEHIARWQLCDTKLRAERAAAVSYMRMYNDIDGSLKMNARLAPADGAIIKKAIERLVEQAPPTPDGLFGSHEARCADALVQMASTNLAEDADRDRATVVVHVGAEALNAIHGAAEFDDGTPIPSETARRLACDARLQVVVDGTDGRAIGVGRTTRTVPAWLLRQLRRRDRGCRFADCGRTRGVQAHHVIHWAHGGRTDLDNLVMVCPYHHRKVHEEKFKLILDGFGRVRTVRADGRPLRTRPTTLRPDLRERIFGPQRRLPVRC